MTDENPCQSARERNLNWSPLCSQVEWSIPAPPPTPRPPPPPFKAPVAGATSDTWTGYAINVSTRMQSTATSSMHFASLPCHAPSARASQRMAWAMEYMGWGTNSG